MDRLSPHLYAELSSPSVLRWAGDFAKGVMQAMRRSPPAKGEAPAEPTISVARGRPVTGTSARPAAPPPPETGLALPTLTAEQPEARAIALLDVRTQEEVDRRRHEAVLQPKDEFREGVGFPVMVIVPAGTFTMGSPEKEEGRFRDEGPQHEVRIARPLAVGKYPVTVDEFKTFVTETGHDAGSAAHIWNGRSWELREGRSWRDPGFAQTGSHPVVCVNWNDAHAYAGWLSGKTGKAYRLLSEAEWEYATRGQTEAGDYPRYFFGNEEADLCRYGNGADQTAKAKLPGAHTWTVAPCSDGYIYTSPVGSFLPNAFGLHDMAGNVWEWVEDCYHETYHGSPVDGKAWTDKNSDTRVLRGGSWNVNPRNLRAAVRNWFRPDFRYASTGFRLARTLSH
jgi:formylglycine-generating enzyme required for sulfatase activity